MSNDQSPQTDGSGATHDFFGQSTDVDATDTSTRERMYRRFDIYVLAPFRVAWSDWRAKIGIAIITFFILMGTVGTRLVEAPRYNDVERNVTWFDDWSVPLGSDNNGQPLFELLIHTTPPILEMALAGVIFSVVLAIIIGVVAGYKGGTVDYVLMTITDIVMVIPGLPLIIVLVAIWRPQNAFVIGAILAIDSWPSLARMLRSQVLTIRNEEYVEASRAMGVSTRSIVQKDITPQLMPYIMINASNAAQTVIFVAVGLYFLGFLEGGAAYNWGVMMNEAYQAGALSNFGLYGHWLVLPMILICLFSMGLILFSQGMDRVFNTKIRARHAKTVSNEDDGPA